MVELKSNCSVLSSNYNSLIYLLEAQIQWRGFFHTARVVIHSSILNLYDPLLYLWEVQIQWKGFFHTARVVIHSSILNLTRLDVFL